MHTIQEIDLLARDLVAKAEASGVVLTIEQQPRSPLAMGNYRTVVTTRRARHSVSPNITGYFDAGAPKVQRLPADDTEGGEA